MIVPLFRHLVTVQVSDSLALTSTDTGLLGDKRLHQSSVGQLSNSRPTGQVFDELGAPRCRSPNDYRLKYLLSLTFSQPKSAGSLERLGLRLLRLRRGSILRLLIDFQAGELDF